MMVLFHVLKESVVSFLAEVRRDDSLVIQGVSFFTVNCTCMRKSTFGALDHADVCDQLRSSPRIGRLKSRCVIVNAGTGGRALGY